MGDPEYCSVRKIGKIDIENYDNISRIIGALGNKTRVAILAVMTVYDEVCTCELQPALGLPQPTITTHLRKMYDLGILQKREAWKYSYYRINPKYRALIDAILREEGVKLAGQLTGQ
ncbi:MAG: metalloregulator ArsR/SmtB family transcription factor [Thermoplasmatales archaeon]